MKTLRRTAELGLLAAILAIAACGGNLHPAISVSAAQTIVKNYDAKNTQANNTIDVALQNADEEGSAAEIDNAYYALTKIMGESSEGGSNEPEPTWKATIYPGPTSGVPSFLAVVDTTSTPKAPPQLFEFVQDTKKSPWRVLYEVPVGSKPTASVPAFSPSNGVLDITDQDNGVIARFAEYRSDPAGTSSSPAFASGQYTSQWRQSIEKSFSALGANGKGTVNCTVDAKSPIVTVPLANGSTLVFGTIETVETVTSTGSIAFIQPETRSNFPAFLSPGSYSSITMTFLDQVAVVVPASGTPSVIGDYEGAIAARGNQIGGVPGGTGNPGPSPSGSTTI